MTELGTSFADNRVVRGVCGQCGKDEALLYSHPQPAEGDVLMCADCSRKRAKERPTKQACDNCGDTGNVWRDPVTRKNEYLCIKCHDPSALFQNRWANKVRESKPLSIHAKAVCTAAGYGTDCKGEVKPRGGQHKGRLLCNKHAGKQGVGPNG